MAMQRKNGTVRWYDKEKGYGFIQRNAGNDVFLHFSQIEEQARRSLTEGQAVSFYVMPRQEGLQATKVRGENLNNVSSI